MATRKTVVRAGSSDTMDAGLRAYFLKVYSYMGIGLVLTAVTAYISSFEFMLRLFFRVSGNMIMGYSPLGYVALFSPLVLIFMFSSAVSKMNVSKARGIFLLFAVLNGLSLGPLFLIYTGESVIRVFLISAATFFGMAIYGYTTKRDLTKLGSFLLMGLIGVIIASVVNLFLQSTAMSWALSLIGVGIFVGLTAFDTQKIKQYYLMTRDENTRQVLAIRGALHLYLDFLNLFLYLLRLMGDRR